ncbi:ROK family transcriptional regulator [Spirochaeta cellobiosiphila]|uniref:ROK family transcriptional regulator n=1 Tax=Spirochaeta cellobiosiphila TaxID=504483 RepID=UPI0003F854FE|nr:ROK family transcriptional regulator [Spirochaeta cellobiosiphila]
MASTLYVKDINKKLLIRALRDQRQATIRELADITKLTIVTVKSLLNELIDQGKVQEGESVPSNGGRPSQQYVFNSQSQLGLVIFGKELEGLDSLYIRIIDLYGQVLDSQIESCTYIDSEYINNVIGKMFEKFPQIGAISLGLPGIEYEGQIVSLDYKGLVGTPLIQQLQERYNIPVVIENDVNAAVMGRGQCFEAAQSEIYVYFASNSGPGAGIRWNGQLIKGAKNSAGEVGWLPFGIKWGAELVNNKPAFVKAAALLLVSLVVLYDPESLVVYGEFIDDEYLDEIGTECKTLLSQRSFPSLTRVDDFSSDYEQGLITITLEKLFN